MTRDRAIAIACALVPGLVAALVYAPTTAFPFVGWEDDLRLLSNPTVRAGLSQEGLSWAFTSTWSGSWSPLAWLSHMLDFTLYAGDAGGHHAVNVALHAANAVLLFAGLRSATGAPLRSAAVALLFAVHPIHVETVAWVSERRGLLSATFGLAALWCHASDARRSEPRLRLQALLLFALALMTKPMWVTLPLLLLVLDRIREPVPPLAERAARLWPWFLLSSLSAAITVYAAEQAGVIRTLPLGDRMANALVTSVLYVAKLVWPARLSAFYPHPGLPGGTPWSALQVGGAAAFWIAAGTLAWWSGHRALRAGLAWYGIALLPVCGLVQVGSQAMADRFAYLPAIGLYVALLWPLGDWIGRRGRVAQGAVAATFAAALAALVVVSERQIDVWRSSETLFLHAVETTDANFTMHYNLANTLKDRGRVEEAIAHYRRAVEIHPGMARAHYNLANTLASEGRTEEAIHHYRAALAAAPAFRAAREALGRMLVRQGDLPAALAHYREEVRRYPRSISARVSLAHLLRIAGDLPRAAATYEAAAALAEGEVAERWQAEAQAVRAQQAERPARP